VIRNAGDIRFLAHYLSTFFLTLPEKGWDLIFGEMKMTEKMVEVLRQLPRKIS